MTLVDRLLNHPITLIRRQATGSDDSWGQPITTEVRTETFCHYQQLRTGDQDRNTENTVYEDVSVWIPADSDLGPYDAVELTMGGRTETMEVIGQPFAAHNARLDQVNHIKMMVRRAAP